MDQLNQYSPGSAAISTAGNITGIGLQAIINRRAERRQWNRNVAMWKMQNEYNSPLNQMNRLKEAGLNPNLMYGKGTVGNAQTMPQYNALPVQGMGDVFGKSIAGIQGILEVEQKRISLRASELGIDEQVLNNGLKQIELDYEKWRETLRREVYTSELAVQFYNEQIKQIEKERYDYGVDGATTQYKILWEHIHNRMRQGELTPQDVKDMMRNMVYTEIGYGVAKDVFGFTLAGQFAKGKNKGGYKESQTITTKMGNRTVKTTRSGF